MTGQLSYDLLNVFTLPGQAYTGNALAVFYDESEHKNLTQKQLQTVATQLNLSETTFALQPSEQQKSEGATHFTRIFVIDAEIPFAGHPTLGTAASLLSRSLIPSTNIVQFCGAGPIKLTASADATQISLTAPHKFMTGALPLPAGLLANALTLDPSKTDGLEGYVSSCGLPMLYVRLRSEEDIVNLKPSSAGVGALLDSVRQHSAEGVLALDVFFAEKRSESETRVHARVLLEFQPEDSATGSAGVALGPVLHKLSLTSSKPSSTTTYTIAQGAEMNRPSVLIGQLVTDAEGKVAECSIGGEVHKVGEGWVAVPPSN